MRLIRFSQKILHRYQKWEFAWLVIIFLLSIVIRWYLLPQHLFFGFEQGRDAKIITEIFTQHEFKLVGPKTDLAGIFHGAYYYYLMLPTYILSHGSPLAASFWLVIISSFTSVISYFFARNLFRSSKAAALTSLLVTFSYEYIIYARWLSNVTPAIPLILLTFWFLWQYHHRQKPWSFVAAVAIAAFASQFEIVLVLLFGWVFLLLFILGIIKWPSLKSLFIAIVLSCLIFTPHLIFNFRNQNIMLSSIHSYSSENTSRNKVVDLTYNWHYFVQNYRLTLQHSLSLPDQPLALWSLSIVLIVGILARIKKQSQAKNQKAARQKVFFLLIWLSMCIPVLPFHDVAGLIQLYLGIGLAFIFLFVLACQSLWQIDLRRTPLGKYVVIGSLLIISFGITAVVQKLQKNDDVFFITIQKGLNYVDQQRALEYIHQDAQGQTYRFVAYTIPYLHPEGWQYLQHFFHPQDKTDDGSKLVYIVIEAQVEPFWSQKWTEELGVSSLVSEKDFGIIRVQKRILK